MIKNHRQLCQHSQTSIKVQQHKRYNLPGWECITMHYHFQLQLYFPFCLPLSMSALSASTCSFSPWTWTSASPPGSYSANLYTDSSADVPPSTAEVPLSLSLSPALSPEEFERLWLQRQPMHADQGNSMEGDYFMPKASSSWDRNWGWLDGPDYISVKPLWKWNLCKVATLRGLTETLLILILAIGWQMLLFWQKPFRYVLPWLCYY